MKVGYARVSTSEQQYGITSQITALTEFGCDQIFSEHVSAVQRRTELDNALQFIRRGDTLCVTKLDRLARSVFDLIKIVDHIESKGASLTIMDMNLDTASPTGRLLLHLVGSIAEWERNAMKQRQREAIQLAKAEGKFRGRAPTARRKSSEVIALHSSGTGAAAIAEKLNISRASVYRILAANSGSKAAAA